MSSGHQNTRRRSRCYARRLRRRRGNAQFIAAARTALPAALAEIERLRTLIAAQAAEKRNTKLHLALRVREIGDNDEKEKTMRKLRNITQQELDLVVEKHGKWLNGEEGGERANLSYANLSYANLDNANLSYANLSYANLDNANLSYANLSYANLSCARLSYASLFCANLSCARLSYARLDNANLDNASLFCANLDNANLSYASLFCANLFCANLSYANLDNANLFCARLDNARLDNARLEIPVVPDLDKSILAAVSGGENKLEMGGWHKCETTHCRAGWAIHLAGEKGYALEKRLGPNAAGALIYHKSAGYIPNFYASMDDAMADIRQRAEAVE